jgi:radical SAM superfamily enzyme YgiQ (UPF0313 family)
MPLEIVLINPYELGRQPFGLAHPTAQLRAAGHQVRCIDLSQEKLTEDALKDADLIAIQMAMHTATRIAEEALPRIRKVASKATLCAYGLYAPINAGWLQQAGITTILGGEFEPGLLALAAALERGEPIQTSASTNLEKITFSVPDRTTLAPLANHARLREPDGTEITMGFADASRGCKHLCRHCPVVPVYGGRFRIVPADIVMADIRQQVAAGAEHISFGDPDFLNGPTHALRVARALHDEFPALTFDAVIKVEHVLNHADILPELRACGLRFLISAVESVDNDILALLEKGHTNADFEQAVALLRRLDIGLAPTFLAFTPWTTLTGYVTLLDTLARLELVASVPPVQLAIRLLIPANSRLLELDEVQALVGAFDQASLGHPWLHSDPRVDALQQAIEQLVSQEQEAPRATLFAQIRALAYAAIGRSPAAMPPQPDIKLAHHTENWYCCAEPTQQQLSGW